MYHKWGVKNGFTFAFQFFLLISDRLLSANWLFLYKFENIYKLLRFWLKLMLQWLLCQFELKLKIYFFYLLQDTAHLHHPQIHLTQIHQMTPNYLKKRLRFEEKFLMVLTWPRVGGINQEILRFLIMFLLEVIMTNYLVNLMSLWLPSRHLINFTGWVK